MFGKKKKFLKVVEFKKMSTMKVNVQSLVIYSILKYSRVLILSWELLPAK